MTKSTRAEAVRATWNAFADCSSGIWEAWEAYIGERMRQRAILALAQHRSYIVNTTVRVPPPPYRFSAANLTFIGQPTEGEAAFIVVDLPEVTVPAPEPRAEAIRAARDNYRDACDARDIDNYHATWGAWNTYVAERYRIDALYPEETE